VKTPTWAEVEAFLRADRWEEVRETGHAFFRKTLDDGRVLETHRSFAGKKTMSRGRFAAILRSQLECSPDDFWEAIRTGRPMRRPSSLPPPAPTYPLWAVRVLTESLHMTEDEVRALSPEEVVERAEAYWSQRRPGS